MKIAHLEDSFDNEEAERKLNLSIDKLTTYSDLVRKSMYDFDLDTPEGINKLMSLLPIMDPEILKDIMTEIWPNYPTDIDARKHRLEIKGWARDTIKDFEEGNEDPIEGSETNNTGEMAERNTDPGPTNQNEVAEGTTG